LKKIRINIPGKEYNVYLGAGILSKITSIFVKEKIKSDLLLVIDRKVNKYFKDIIDCTFINYSGKVKRIIITSSEEYKSFDTLQKIHSALIKNNFGRDSILISIGGGIVGDITGFAASTYMRGIRYIQVPTTLLAAVDSSVGGKTGINFYKTKNIIGSFYQPEFVLIDALFFNTLPDEERLCGLGEVIKHCFLTNNTFLNFVENNVNGILANDFKKIEKVIIESLKFKGSVVEEDEKEAGIRKVLNLGHTFAHAFEVQQNHKLKHGQAVIIGITCALYLSKKLNFISDKNFSKYLNFLALFGEKIRLENVDINLLFRAMQRDKKNRENEIKFVLIKNVGEIVTDVPAERKLVRDSISKAIKHFS